MFLVRSTAGQQVGALYVFIINRDIASPSFLIISLVLFVFIINGNLPLCCSYLFSEIPRLLLSWVQDQHWEQLAQRERATQISPD